MNTGKGSEDGYGSIPRQLGANAQRAGRWGCVLMVAAAAVLFALAGLVPYTEYLWFVHDARQPQVFSKVYEVRGTLFTFGFVIALAVLYFSVRKALQLSMVYLQSPSSIGQALASHAVGWVQSRGSFAIKIAAPILAGFFALGLANEWNTYLLWRNPQAFGTKDPIFGLDLGFFVFTLPFYRALANFAFSVLFLTTVITLAVYVGLQVLAALAKIELGRQDVRTHIGLLVGATLLAYAALTGLKCYEYGLVDGPQFTGAGYAAARQLPVQVVVSILIGVLGVIALVSGRFKRSYAILGYGAAGVAAIALIGMAIYPFILQKLVVEPNKLNAEGPFASRGIAMTRYAYGLDTIEVRDWNVQTVPSAEDVAEAGSTLENMRLWDPDVLREAVESSQGFRSYYTFNDVDVDRYTIGGKQTLVMLAPRDIRLSGLPESGKTWVTEHLQYTHGYGVTMSPVNTASPDGQPAFWIKDLPPVTPPEIPLTQARLYFSDIRNREGASDDEYAVVDTKVDEFDYLNQNVATSHRWEGKRGIPIGAFIPRLAFSVALGDGNLLVSTNITDNSRLLIHRNVIDRASRVYPFLRFDHDPYVIVVDGRIVWVLDGYTTSDMVPYSRPTLGVNYIRNSVKVAIDAYTGEMTAYAVQPGEPVLRAYRAIYPGLIQDASGMPPQIRAHLRYPEDLFTIQSAMLTAYHVTNPTSFLTNSDAWERANQVGLTNSRELMDPYYVQMRLPSEQKDGFMLILPFTPINKGNMSAWLAAHCDPDKYGKLVLYQFARGSLLAGPEQMEANFQQDPIVSSTVNRQLSNDKSKVIVGNLLVIPIGKSVMYAEPVFLKSATAGIQAIPELKKVVLAVNGQVVLGDTYKEALDKMFGAHPAAGQQPATTTTPATGQAPPKDLPQVREALGLLDQADQALRSGDFARYGDLQKQARQKLRELVSPNQPK